MAGEAVDAARRSIRADTSSMSASSSSSSASRSSSATTASSPPATSSTSSSRRRRSRSWRSAWCSCSPPARSTCRSARSSPSRRFSRRWCFARISGSSARRPASSPGRRSARSTALLVAYLRLPSFLVTLATMGFLAGVARWLTDLQSVPITNDTFNNIFGAGSLFGVPSLLIWTLAIVACRPFLLPRDPLRRPCPCASATAPQSARAVGIKVDRIRFSVMVLSGLCAGLAGLLYAGPAAWRPLHARRDRPPHRDRRRHRRRHAAERRRRHDLRRADRLAADGPPQQRPHPDGARASPSS